MRETMDAVADFMGRTGEVLPNRPSLPLHDTRAVRRSLLKEEYEEYEAAEDTNDMVAIADALADLIYVAIGTALRYGIPLDEVLREVHRTNLAKAHGDGSFVMLENGKLVRPEGWSPPEVAEVLRESGWRAG